MDINEKISKLINDKKDLETLYDLTTNKTFRLSLKEIIVDYEKRIKNE